MNIARHVKQADPAILSVHMRLVDYFGFANLAKPAAFAARVDVAHQLDRADFKGLVRHVAHVACASRDHIHRVYLVHSLVIMHLVDHVGRVMLESHATHLVLAIAVLLANLVVRVVLRAAM